MWDEVRQKIESELSAGEQLVWNGRPQQGFLLRSTDALMIPFSILWCGFAIFWETAVWTTNAPLIFRLWGIPFVCVGLYMVIGRFFVDRILRGKTYYGITADRAIIVGGLFSKQVKSLNLKNLSDVTLTEKSNGVGTISFGTPVVENWWGNARFGNRQQPQIPQFEAIPDARKIFDIIRNAQL